MGPGWVSWNMGFIPRKVSHATKKYIVFARIDLPAAGVISEYEFSIFMGEGREEGSIEVNPSDCFFVAHILLILAASFKR